MVLFYVARKIFVQSAFAKRKRNTFTTNQKFLFVNLNTNACADAIGVESNIYHELTIPVFNLNCTTRFTYRHKKRLVYIYNIYEEVTNGT